MNYWKSICKMKNPAGPDGTQIKWPRSFPSWELQRGSERKSLTNYSAALKTFSPLVNKDKGTHQSCWRIVIMRRQGIAECVSSDAACFPFQAAMLQSRCSCSGNLYSRNTGSGLWDHQMILSSWHPKPLNAPFVLLHPFHRVENQVMCHAQRTGGGHVLKWQLFQWLDKNVHHDSPTRQILGYLQHCNSFVLFPKAELNPSLTCNLNLFSVNKNNCG